MILFTNITLEVPFPLNVITDPAEITLIERPNNFWDGALGRLSVAIGHRAASWGWSL